MTGLRVLSPQLREHWRGIALVIASACAWSTAGLFSRAVPVDIWTMQFWRALSGAAFIYAAMAVEAGFRLPRGFARISRQGLIVVPLSALSMISYIAALRLTSVAEVMIVYATTPFVTAAVAWLWLGEAMDRRAIAASLVALAGIALTVLGPATAATERFWGDALAFLMVLGFAFVVVMGRRSSSASMSVVNILAMLVCALGCLPLASPLAVSGPDFGLLVAFGAITLGLGLILLAAGTRRLGAGEAALITLIDVPLSPLWVWLAFGERPGAFALSGGAIVLGAVVWYLAGKSPTLPSKG